VNAKEKHKALVAHKQVFRSSAAMVVATRRREAAKAAKREARAEQIPGYYLG
jgi:hypothetical protein